MESLRTPAMSLLTSRQADELHKSIIAYLTSCNLNAAAAALRIELEMGEDQLDAAMVKKYEGLLEKKWTSIVRLQKKMMDLESRNKALQDELDNATPSSMAMRKNNPSFWLPQPHPRYTLESHRNAINCIAFHPIFSCIATGSDDYTIKVWDWEAGELEKTLKGHTRAILDLDYGGPRGNILLASCSSDLTIKLWDPADDYKNIRTLPGHDHTVSAVRFIPASTNLLISASKDKTLKIWDVGTGYCLKTLRGHTEWVRDVFPSFDGRFILSAGDDMTARLWDISVPNAASKSTLIGHEHYIECCALAPPSTYKYFAPMAGRKKAIPASNAAEFMATGSRDKTIRLWDSHGTCLKTLIGHDNWLRALVFHPGGKYLLSAADDKTVRCWDLSQDGRCARVIDESHNCFITSLRWAPSIVRDSIALESTTDSPTREGLEPRDTQIRCVIATGAIDWKLRIFSS